MADTLRVLIIGAHPDDCDVMAGGLAALYAGAGHTVKFVSMTNGDTGHFQMGGGELARRRYAETQASARVLGIEYQVFDHHCGHLEPTLPNRQNVIRLIREFRPDMVLTHTADDYHPDHRYTSILVQDAAYLVTVPGMCPLTPHLRRNPVFGYVIGSITTSSTFKPTVFLDVTDVMDRKLQMLMCHESQFLEWIPYNQNILDQVPADAEGRRAFQVDFWTRRFEPFAQANREALIEHFGRHKGEAIRFAEAVQVTPFGTVPDLEGMKRLFPFSGLEGRPAHMPRGRS
jgi:LmbE family N-acetylglucosaminyl deacetylase